MRLEEVFMVESGNLERELKKQSWLFHEKVDMASAEKFAKSVDATFGGGPDADKIFKAWEAFLDSLAMAGHEGQ